MSFVIMRVWHQCKTLDVSRPSLLDKLGA